MNIKNKNLLAIHLNEFNFKYLLKGAKKYKCQSILKVLALKNVSTYTKDKKQDYNLDPWVQSVSINTGKSSEDHKILKLGQHINKNTKQIWDVLCGQRITCSVWGTMNSRLKKNKYLNYYFPDPWNFRDSTWPKNLMGMYYLPNYYAKNYLKFSYFKFFYYSVIFFFTLFSKSKILKLMSDLFFSAKIFFKTGISNFVLFFIYDLIQLNVFDYNDQKKKSSFSIIFLNSIAHYQHNNWNEKKNQKYFFMFTEKIFSKILLLKKRYKSIIIFNGFTQKRIKSQYILRPKEPQKFISNFIKFKNLEQDMTNGGFIFFDNKKERINGFKILNQLYCKNKKVFQVKYFKGNSISYKINLKSKIKIQKKDNKNLNNLNRYLIEDIKNNKINLKDKIDITHFFIRKIEFLKSSGIHVPQGLILHENVKSLSKFDKIENHKLFNIFFKHFKEG